jgi:hypothetical protein
MKSTDQHLLGTGSARLDTFRQSGETLAVYVMGHARHGFKIGDVKKPHRLSF